MKIFGNIMNRIGESATIGAPAPEVGIGVTEYCWSDRHAYTILEILSPKRIVVTKDSAERIDKNGMSESQEYKFTTQPDGPKIILSLRKDGAWRREGSGRGANSFVVGRREEWFDFSF